MVLNLVQEKTENLIKQAHVNEIIAFFFQISQRFRPFLSKFPQFYVFIIGVQIGYIFLTYQDSVSPVSNLNFAEKIESNTYSLVSLQLKI